MNNKERLEKQLDAFLFNKNKKADGFVISIQGHWGIGKTYFWKNYIRYKEQGDKFVNISLFGIHSLDDIKKKILFKTSDRFKLNDKIQKHLGSSKLLGIDLASMVSIISKDDFKEIIICFDDFERISPNLNMTEILGFISELKEEYNCKIVLINNNDTLKEQDKLNHMKIIKRIINIDENQKNLLKTNEEELFSNYLDNKKEIKKENDDNEKYIITSTNNEEIFNKYIEKIVDVTLWYEPTLRDIFDIVSELNKEKNYIDFGFLEKLFSQLSNRDKKFNIRLIKQVVLKLELLEVILREKDTHMKIKNGIFLNVFKLVVKENIDYNILNIPVITPFDKEIFINLVKKHQLNVQGFQAEVKKYNDFLNSTEYNESLYNEIQETYFRYLYELTYEAKIFSKEFYDLLNTPNIDVIKLLSFISFSSYINFIKKQDSVNDEKYQKLFIEKSKEYIKNNIKNLNIDRIYENNKFIEELDDKNELKDFYEEERRQIEIDILLDIDSIKKLIKKKLESNGWNVEEELLLVNINNSQHEKWLIEDREYFELTFDFIDYLKTFSGSQPFKGFYDKTIEIYKKLYQDNVYRNKLEPLIQRFNINIEE